MRAHPRLQVVVLWGHQLPPHSFPSDQVYSQLLGQGPISSRITAGNDDRGEGTGPLVVGVACETLIAAPFDSMCIFSPVHTWTPARLWSILIGDRKKFVPRTLKLTRQWLSGNGLTTLRLRIPDVAKGTIARVTTVFQQLNMDQGFRNMKILQFFIDDLQQAEVRYSCCSIPSID